MDAPERGPRRPKIGYAIALLKSAPKEIEADLQRVYPGRRIAEFWRTISPKQTGEMTPRELVVLVEELPDDSRFKRARGHAWSLLEELTAGVVNVLQAHREDYRNAHGKQHEWEPITARELSHEVVAREARERQQAQKRSFGPEILGRMLRGELLMTDIDTSRPIEEVLAA